MFDTFIALFGGLFLLGRKINKRLVRAGNEQRLREYNEYRSVQDKISYERLREYKSVQNMICDEQFINSKLRPKFVKDRLQILDEISEDLTEVFGKRWKRLFRNWRFYENDLNRLPADYGFYNVWCAAYGIYLSRFGQVDTTAYNTGSVMHGAAYEPQFFNNAYIPELLPTELEIAQKSKECNRNACRVIERNMQK